MTYSSLLDNFLFATTYDQVSTINSGTGIRSMITDTTVSGLNINTTDALCVPYLCGLTATSSGTYQVNVSCSIKTSSSYTINVTVASSTVVSHILLYILAVDQKYNSYESKIFTDYGIGESKDGTQYTTWNPPKGFIIPNLFVGLRSISFEQN